MFTAAVKATSIVVSSNDSNDLPESMERMQLQDKGKAGDGDLIKKYLLENVEEFRQLTELRKQGWDNPRGDEFFQKQRRNADTAGPRMALIFYNMMQEIAEDIDRSTGALTLSPYAKPTILDMCMAPGGFLATVLAKNPWAFARGLSLPFTAGGHKVLLPEGLNAEVEFLDITMLAADMGVTDIPPEHPDASNMLSQRFDPSQLFDLVLCDGQVLRTHARAAYREPREARRLSITQLAIGLEHVKSGGTMIVLLHKVEAPSTVSLLHTFSKFSSVRLFKPTKHHTKRSSFYMIATNIQSQHDVAVQAVQRWKKQWKIATFGTDAEYAYELETANLHAETLLDEFGEEMIELGRGVWRIQANALRKAPFIKK